VLDRAPDRLITARPSETEDEDQTKD
jgi:hypothetical protein